MSQQFGFGSGVLYGTRNDITGSTPIRFGVLQDVQIDFAGDIKELFGQNQYAIDAARGKTKIEGKAKFAQISVLAYASLFFGTSLTTGSILQAYNEADTPIAGATAATSAATASGTTITFSAVPAGCVVGALVVDTTTTTAIPPGTYVVSKTSTVVTLSQTVTGVLMGDSITFAPTITSANATNFVADLGIFYASNATQLTFSIPAAGALLSAGNYFEALGVYSVSAADASKAMLVNYSYSSSTVGFTLNVGNPLMGTTPKFQCNFFNSYEGNTLGMILYSCVSSKLMIPTKLDDYIIEELDFSAYQNAAGQTVTLSASN